MVSFAVWTFLVFTLLQCYAAYVLSRKPWGPSRLVFAVLFLVNAFLTLEGLARSMGAPAPVPFVVFEAVDAVTYGLIVLAAEAGSVTIHPRKWNRGVVFLAVLLTMVSLVATVGGLAFASGFLLLAYGFFGLRLASAMRRNPAAPHAAWGAWLLAAFMPRAIEIAVEVVGRWEPVAQVFAPVALAGAAAVAAGTGLSLVAARATPNPDRRLMVYTAIAIGALLGLARLAGPVVDPLVPFLSLMVLRPAFVVAGIYHDGLLGAQLDHRALLRHTSIPAGGAGMFLVLVWALPAVLPSTGGLARLAIAAALALATLPLWVQVGRRGSPPQRVPPSAPMPHDGWLEPHVANRDGAAEFLLRAEGAFRSLPEAQRRALTELTRAQRLLLALRGSSPGSLGEFWFTQHGLHLATQIPYRYFSSVVKSVNDSEAGVAVRSSSGVRGQKHYWLTPVGSQRAEALARSLNLGNQESTRMILGERLRLGPLESTDS